MTVYKTHNTRTRIGRIERIERVSADFSVCIRANLPNPSNPRSIHLRVTAKIGYNHGLESEKNS